MMKEITANLQLAPNHHFLKVCLGKRLHLDVMLCAGFCDCEDFKSKGTF
jgi:hypothetical protein